LDNLTRQLRKMESKMKAGQFIDAWRDCTKIIAMIERAKRDIIEAKSNEE